MVRLGRSNPNVRVCLAQSLGLNSPQGNERRVQRQEVPARAEQQPTRVRLNQILWTPVSKSTLVWHLPQPSTNVDPRENQHVAASWPR